MAEGEIAGDEAPDALLKRGILPDRCRMLVVGDSHSRFWSGQDGIALPDRIAEITTFHVGAALAFSLAIQGSRTGGPERSTRYLDLVAASPRGLPEYLMFSFGEIDIRAHIVRRAMREGIVLDRAVRAVTDNYRSFLADMRRYDRPILVWGPPASQVDGLSYNPGMPVHGPEIERNAATALFHAHMAEAADADPDGFTFLSILTELLLPDGATRRGFFSDGTHLDQVAMPMAIAAVTRATGWRPDWQPERNDPVIPPETRAAPRPVNVAPAATCRMMPRNVTRDPDPFAADPAQRRPIASSVHTDPALLIDLRSVRTVDIVRIALADAADDTLALATSLDARTFVPVAEPAEVDGEWRIWRFDAADFRLLRLTRKGRDVTLAVAGVEVIARGYVAPG